jgi:hypothetical protein
VCVERERELAVAFPRVCEWQCVRVERERERESLQRETGRETFPLCLRVALGGWERGNERERDKEREGARARERKRERALRKFVCVARVTTHKHVDTHMETKTHAHTHTHNHACMHARTHPHPHTRTHMQAHAHTHSQPTTHTHPHLLALARQVSRSASACPPPRVSSMHEQSVCVVWAWVSAR